MKIILQLYATLGDCLPDGAQRHSADIEIDSGDTVATVIKRYQVPEKLAHLVIVNGRFIAPSERARNTLEEGDVLAIWPPVAGG